MTIEVHDIQKQFELAQGMLDTYVETKLLKLMQKFSIIKKLLQVAEENQR